MGYDKWSVRDSELHFAQKLSEKQEQFCSIPVERPHTIPVKKTTLDMDNTKSAQHLTCKFPIRQR